MLALFFVVVMVLFAVLFDLDAKSFLLMVVFFGLIFAFGATFAGI